MLDIQNVTVIQGGSGILAESIYNHGVESRRRSLGPFVPSRCCCKRSLGPFVPSKSYSS